MLTDRAKALRTEYKTEGPFWTIGQRAGFVRRVKNFAASEIQNPPVGTDQTQAQMLVGFLSMWLNFHIDTWKESK